MAIAHMPVRRSFSGVARAEFILHAGYVILPAIAGVDKFFYALTNWTQYLWSEVPRMTGIGPTLFMQIVGGVEIAAALLVLIAPRIGGVIVALWLWSIIANLILAGNYYDVALRDFGLSLGALALASLAKRARTTETIP